MYLKEIEVSGFKSFADKLSIKLDNSITCIVGPNGSGKSNVVDAVRWVLGEQSVKSLRGDGNMSDVIFSGSKSRNPLSVASVSLIFDNSDNYLNIGYSEVSVKRRVYRTGENEYFLNGEKCRLKDITDLFIDSGIGKESFNIISQGEVMRILSNSSHDRRIIFEEAAGVLKYKKRKEEALRKLDRTNNNLDRANDIIVELENQVNPLREQSIKAKEYLENKKALEQVEVALLAYEIDTINNEITIKKEELEKLNKESLDLSTSTNKIDASLEVKKQELLKLEKSLNDANSKLFSIIKEVERINGEKRIIKERSKYDASDSKVHDNLANLKETKLMLDNDIFKLEKDIEIDLEKLNIVNDSVKTIEMSIIDSNKRREDCLREYNYKSKEYLELKNRISVLESHIENGGALPNSVKAVLDNPRLIGLHNTIGNLISVDAKFTKALEVALLSSKNYVVCDNESVAKSAINYLKEQKLGRCTFYPINIIKPRFIDNATLNLLKQQLGFIDTFNNLVNYNKMYDSIINNQLGNVIVTLDIDSANKISKLIGFKYKVVTLDGEIINVGGSITGGSLNLNKSIISEKQELESLKTKKKNLKNVIIEIENELNKIDTSRLSIDDDLFNKRQEVIMHDEIIKNKRLIIDDKKNQQLNVVNEINSLEKLIDYSLSDEEDKIMQEYSDKVKEKVELESSIEKLTNNKDRLKSELEEIEAKNKFDNFNLRKIDNDIKNLEIAINKMDVKLDHYLEVLNEEYSLTFEKAFNDYKLEIDVDEARDKVSVIKNNIKRIGMVNLDSISEYERVNERYSFLINTKEDLLKAKDSLFEIIQEMDEVMENEFVSTFKKVREEFKMVFKQLFNGGEADLKLTMPDNILETGVEIVACPPGKKLTTISLLSGGEKTLTAISLLFAILNVRTVPFCLFDEVEAALDEANVDNFGKYLDHYKDKTQFLLITHKKKTMEYAKTLYGITMQESGVSKLVSVKLDKLVN